MRIDLFYSRPGCESCAKVRAELERRSLGVETERSSSEPMTAAEAATLLGGVHEVTILRGRRADRRARGAVAVSDLLGPTGKIRAPMLLSGSRLLVGFETSFLKEWLDES